MVPVYANIHSEPLHFTIATTPEVGAWSIPLHAAPDDDRSAVLERRITDHVRYPWVTDRDHDLGREVLYQLGPADPWLLALGALISEGIVQGAGWDAVKLVAMRALSQLRSHGVAPASTSSARTTTSAWRNRLSIELGVSAEKMSLDDELIGRLFIGLRMSVSSDRETTTETTPQADPKASLKTQKKL